MKRRGHARSRYARALEVRWSQKHSSFLPTCSLCSSEHIQRMTNSCWCLHCWHGWRAVGWWGLWWQDQFGGLALPPNNQANVVGQLWDKHVVLEGEGLGFELDDSRAYSWIMVGIKLNGMVNLIIGEGTVEGCLHTEGNGMFHILPMYPWLQ